MSNLGSVAFMVIPTAGLVGATRSFLGMDGNELAHRLAALPFLAVAVVAGYLDYRYVKRPVDSDL